MTINKSQSQTLYKVGIYLRQPVFDHGQLYVTFSRVRSSEYFKVLVMQFEQLNNLEFVYTDNVVYRQILLEQNDFNPLEFYLKTIQT